MSGGAYAKECLGGFVKRPGHLTTGTDPRQESSRVSSQQAEQSIPTLCFLHFRALTNVGSFGNPEA